jgi:hypothetical protein
MKLILCAKSVCMNERHELETYLGLVLHHCHLVNPRRTLIVFVSSAATREEYVMALT